MKRFFWIFKNTIRRHLRRFSEKLRAFIYSDMFDWVGLAGFLILFGVASKLYLAALLAAIVIFAFLAYFDYHDTRATLAIGASLLALSLALIPAQKKDRLERFKIVRPKIEIVQCQTQTDPEFTNTRRHFPTPDQF